MTQFLKKWVRFIYKKKNWIDPNHLTHKRQKHQFPGVAETAYPARRASIFWEMDAFIKSFQTGDQVQYLRIAAEREVYFYTTIQIVYQEGAFVIPQPDFLYIPDHTQPCPRYGPKNSLQQENKTKISNPHIFYIHILLMQSFSIFIPPYSPGRIY